MPSRQVSIQSQNSFHYVSVKSRKILNFVLIRNKFIMILVYLSKNLYGGVVCRLHFSNDWIVYMVKVAKHPVKTAQLKKLADCNVQMEILLLVLTYLVERTTNPLGHEITCSMRQMHADHRTNIFLIRCRLYFIRHLFLCIAYNAFIKFRFYTSA